MDIPTDSRPLSRTEAASFLTARGCRISPATLAAWASRGAGPRFRRWGRLVRYQPADLLAWAETHWRDPAPRATGEAA